MAENIVQERGIGNWEFCLYNPTPNEKLGPYFGILQITKDFHTIVDEENRNCCLVVIPSPNVAYVVNRDIETNVVLEQTKNRTK